MRLDKFLQVSRLVKRRTVAAELCRGGRVTVNGHPGKPGTTVSPGDRIEIGLGSRRTAAEVLEVPEKVRPGGPPMVRLIDE